MFYVRKETQSDFRIDKFYHTNEPGWGHFIVLKGFRLVDGNLFFEAYDPYSLGNTYTDQSFKGKNRYYRAEDIDYATQVWWDYAIVVGENESAGRKITVDPSKIIHKPGR
jgi:hypothetical protein